jgi:hypothetical protein
MSRGHEIGAGFKVEECLRVCTATVQATHEQCRGA